jgi:tetratricopeptide (TPR) repeat protein
MLEATLHSPPSKKDFLIMKRLPIIAGVAAALLAACVALTTSRSAAEPISGADSLTNPWSLVPQAPLENDAAARFQSQDYDGALKTWRAAVKANPDLPPAQVIMAQMYYQANMPVDAEIALKKAIAEEPNDPEAYALLAIAAMHVQQRANAEDLYRKAQSLMPSFDKSAKRKQFLQPRIYAGLAMVAESHDDWKGALKILDQWLKLDPKNSMAMQRVAYCLYRQKDVEGALAMLRQAAKVDTDMLPPEGFLAQFYQRSGDRENAAKWMAAAVDVAPENVRTRVAVGQWALDTGQLEEARKQAVAAVQIAPDSFPTRLFRGAVANFEKDYETAESNLDAALKLSPRSFGARNNLALALIGQKGEAKHNRALELAETNVRQFPQSPEAASTYGYVLYRLGRLKDAEKALKPAASLVNSDADTAYIIACVAADSGRKAEAVPLLELALKSTKPAMYRQETKALLGRLKK